MSRAAFSPTVLLLDDDQVITRRWSKEFHKGTSLGVVVANSLAQGREIIESNEISVDAVVADIFFDHGTDDPERGVYDGLEFLRRVGNSGKHLPMFVISASSEMLDYRKRAIEQNIPVLEFFDKIYAADERDPAWVRIQRSVLERKFGADSEVSKVFEESPKGDRRIDVVNQALCRLQMPIRTYVQGFAADSGLFCQKPIEVICVAQASDEVRAYAPCLGLLSSGRGIDVEAAIEDLKDAIVIDTLSLFSDPGNSMSAYPTKVAEKLHQYVSSRESTHAS